MNSIELSDNELQAVHAALRDKISALNGVHPFVKYYRHMLESVDLKIMVAFSTIKEAHNGSNDKPTDSN